MIIKFNLMMLFIFKSINYQLHRMDLLQSTSQRSYFYNFYLSDFFFFLWSF